MSPSGFKRCNVIHSSVQPRIKILPKRGMGRRYQQSSAPVCVWGCLICTKKPSRCMKHCLRSNVYTDVPRQKLKTVGNKSRNMKSYKRWMQMLFSSVFLSPSPSVLTDLFLLLLFFFSTSAQREIRKEIVIVNIEDDGHVVSNPLPTCNKTLLCFVSFLLTFHGELSWTYVCSPSQHFVLSLWQMALHWSIWKY